VGLLDELLVTKREPLYEIDVRSVDGTPVKNERVGTWAEVQAICGQHADPALYLVVIDER
jgi:hypothetical protein